MVVLEGMVSITDTSANELIRHGPSDFVGELNLLTGQTVFVNAVVIESLRFIAVERDALRALLNENGQLSDLLLSAFMARREALQQVQGVGVQVIGPSASETTRQLLEFLRANSLPYTWDDASAPGSSDAPLVRLPGGGELHNPSAGQMMPALRIWLELATREEVDLLIVGAGPAGLAAAVHGASEGLDTLVGDETALGGQSRTRRHI